MDTESNALMESYGNFLFVANQWADLDLQRQDDKITLQEQVDNFGLVITVLALGFLQAMSTFSNDEVEAIAAQHEKLEKAFKEIM